MAGAGFDADQHRVVATLGALQGGDEFETVAGHHAVVGVGRGHKRRRIACAGLDVVIRRIGKQRLELLGIVGDAKIFGPGPAFGEQLEAQHVHHAHGRQASAEQFRPLRHYRADEQPAVAAALDGQFVGSGVFVADEPLGGGDEVVEHILLLQFRAGQVPCLAIFRPPRRFGWA